MKPLLLVAALCAPFAFGMSGKWRVAKVQRWSYKLNAYVPVENSDEFLEVDALYDDDSVDGTRNLQKRDLNVVETGVFNPRIQEGYLYIFY